MDTETENQPDIITSAVNIFNKAANIADTIFGNQNDSSDIDESMQKKNNKVHGFSNTKKLTIIFGDSLVKKVDDYLLMGSINRKYIVRLRQFSSAKTIDMKNYIKRYTLYWNKYGPLR